MGTIIFLVFGLLLGIRLWSWLGMFLVNFPASFLSMTKDNGATHSVT